MATAAELHRRLTAITLQNLQEVSRLEIQRSPKLISKKVQEFKKGENPDGSRIGYYLNPAYRLFKREINPLAGGTVDLILTGSFTRQLFVDDLGNGRYVFDSRDDKTDLLVSKYGSDIMGLNEDTFREFERTDIIPALNKYIIQRLRR